MPDEHNMLYLILHRVRGEPAFDIASRLDIGSAGGWIIPTSGHRAYPYRWWPLEDLADISDINMSGLHDRPASFDHTIPDNWPDHYRVEATIDSKPVKIKRGPYLLPIEKAIIDQANQPYAGLPKEVYEAVLKDLGLEGETPGSNRKTEESQS